MTTEEKEQKLKELIDGLAEDFKPTVQKIEAKLATTQNHYGDYGSLISQLAKGNKTHAKIFASALIKAGANATGVANGLNLFV